MKLGLIHLSDIHLNENSDINLNISSLIRIILSEFGNTSKLYIVISGDITNTGQAKEFEIAKKYLRLIKSLTNQELPNLVIKYIIVPGNHDCDFKLDTQIRRLSIENMSYRSLGNDDSVFESALSIQRNFWEFYSEFNDVPEQKIYYKVLDNFEEYSICFHCFNTAWMSQIQENPGGLFFPINKFQNTADVTADLNIAVYHHPSNWLNPNADINNKNEFQEYVDKSVSFQLIGHEHVALSERRFNIDNNTTSTYFFGQVFNEKNNIAKSGFQIFKIDIKIKEVIVIKYNWSDILYVPSLPTEFHLNGNSNRIFNLKESFLVKLDEMKIPISIGKTQIKLSDIFIFPDIEHLKLDQSHFEDHFDSSLLVGHDTYKHCLIEGDSQSGKTSLIYMLFRKFYANKYYPIIINGASIEKLEVEKYIKRSFKQIYSEKDIDYERFKQHEKATKILFIDDLQFIKLNKSSVSSILKELSGQFNQIIINVDSAYSILSHLNSDFDNFYTFKLKPLGYKKKNDLIRQYLLLKENNVVINDNELFSKIKFTFDQVRQILGDKIIPSYPVFILSILQALDYKPLNLNETSYGYCYQTLIHYALVKQAELPNDELDTYINYLKELSHFFFENEFEEITEIKFKEFHSKYETSFIIPNFEIVKRVLLSSQILKYEDSTYKFGYKYILYFLIAKHISEIINEKSGKAIVKELFKDIHIEQNANILVFITHHTKDIAFIEESLFTTMIPFEDSIAITLEKEGVFYQLIQDIALEMTDNVIELNRKPEEEREQYLLSADKEQRQLENDENSTKNNSEDGNVFLRPFFVAFRSIEIVGQIIKNRKGSLPKQKLIELISELYLLGFRTIGYLGDFFRDAKVELLPSILEKVESGDSRLIIEQRINLFFQYLTLQACLGIFSKLIYSVGVKELKELYDEIATKIGSPAAKLVSFSINSYYNEVSANEIKVLSKELEDNIVAFQILRSRVKSYVYNNHVDYKKKQKIAETLKMDISASVKKQPGSYLTSSQDFRKNK